MKVRRSWGLSCERDLQGIREDFAPSWDRGKVNQRPRCFSSSRPRIASRSSKDPLPVLRMRLMYSSSILGYVFISPLYAPRCLTKTSQQHTRASEYRVGCIVRVRSGAAFWYRLRSLSWQYCNIANQYSPPLHSSLSNSGELVITS